MAFRPAGGCATSQAMTVQPHPAQPEIAATPEFTFKVAARDGAARTGAISMPRGVIRTPAFMPVGTAATVKGMYPDQVRELGADVVWLWTAAMARIRSAGPTAQPTRQPVIA